MLVQFTFDFLISGHLAIVKKRASNRHLNEGDDTCILDEINSEVNEYSDIPEGTVSY